MEVNEQMARVEAMSPHRMAKRIYNREDNIYDKKKVTQQLIANILLMYMDECRKALAEGERIEISKVGTIIPEVKVHKGHFNLPTCNKDENTPYTKLKIRRNNIFGNVMNDVLLKNIKNNIYGLKKVPFTKQQFNILKDSGYIPEDAEMEDVEADGEE